MPRWLISLFSCWSLVTLASVAPATTDGGITTELLGTAQGGKLALLGERSIQEDCVHAPCVVYVIDTTAPDFERRMMHELPPRYDLLARKHCADKTPKECAREISRYLLEEDRAARDAGLSEQATLLARYLDEISVWQRAQLGPVAPPPVPQPLEGKDIYEENGPELVLSEIPAPRTASGKSEATGPLTLRLKERWTAASFRAITDEDRFCYPQNQPTCHQEERWEDGARKKAWICDVPSERTGPRSAPKAVPNSETDSTPEAGDRPVDCSGRASLVRVEAHWGQGPMAAGRSSWVEPGHLAQAAMSLLHDRTVNLESLAISRHSVSVYALPHATLIVGGFAHGMFANGSWFPLVVALPHPRPRH